MRNDSGFTYFILAALIFAGAVVAKVGLTGDVRCLAMECIAIK